MFGVLSDVGKAFIVSGLLPALLFAVANVVIVFRSDLPTLPTTFIDPTVQLIIVGVLLWSALLLGLNTLIIKFYEGRTGLQRFLLRYFRNRNLARRDALYETLETYRGEYERTADPAKRSSLAHAIEGEWRRIRAAQGSRPLPVDRRRIHVTRLGNLLGAIEEYPSIRYGMDGMVFWPRLVPVIPESYAARISHEKIVFDFQLNLSLLCAILAVEVAVVTVFGEGGGEPELAAAWILGFAVLSYVLYRTAAVTMMAMGELINSAFDLFRHDILKRMRLAVPGSIEEERRLWSRLANYIVSGESFYYPESEEPEDEESRERERVASRIV